MSKKPDSHSIAVESSPAAVNTVCQSILEQLKARQYTQDDIFAVHLALEEALINAVKHGNKMDPDKRVHIDYEINDEKLIIAVTDEGLGYKPDTVPDPRIGGNLLRPNGRGLLLINAYMDEVQYNETGNCIHLVRYRKRPEKARKPLGRS